uniref:Neurensin 2 n=1 Tax=Nannospalax galili TaxID=1026970 RepID=A0A8C6R5I2_NANGA
MEEVGSMTLSCSHSCVCGHDNVEEGKRYGTGSYPHLSYKDCSNTALSEDPEGPQVQCPHQPWPSLCWKITLSSGTLFLLLGVAALTTGYAVPPKLELVNDDKFQSLDDPAADYNQALGTCRLAGVALCGAAGILLAICLFLAASGWLSEDIKAEPLITEADSPVEVFRDEPEQLSPIFNDAGGQSWFLTPPAPLG